MKSVCITKGTARQAKSRPMSPIQRCVTVAHDDDPTWIVGPAGGTSKAGSNSSKQTANDPEKRAKENWKLAERKRRAYPRVMQDNWLPRGLRKSVGKPDGSLMGMECLQFHVHRCPVETRRNHLAQFHFSLLRTRRMGLYCVL